MDTRDSLQGVLNHVRRGAATLSPDALRLLSNHARDSVHAACVLGHSRALAIHIRSDPALAAARYDGWYPLLFVCASPMARHSPRYAAGLLECAEILLEAAGGPAGPSPLLLALENRNVPLALLLKQKGADVPQRDALRKARPAAGSTDQLLSEAVRRYVQRPECQNRMRQVTAGNGGKHIEGPMDPRRMLRLELPNILGAEEHLWQAVCQRGYASSGSLGAWTDASLHELASYAPAGLIEEFVSLGGDVRARDTRGGSMLRAAVRAGNLKVAALLERVGVADDSSAIDKLLGLCLAGHADEVRGLKMSRPDILAGATREDHDGFVRAAAHGNCDQLSLMLEAGFRVDGMNETGSTALHHAAWHGHVNAVLLLMRWGASPSCPDELYGETAREWALQGAAIDTAHAAQYLEIAEALQGR